MMIPIYTIVADIRSQTWAMMRAIRQMFEQRKRAGGTKRPEERVIENATDVDRNAIARGSETPTRTDRDRTEIPPDKREAGLVEQFIESGRSDQDAEQLAKTLVQKDLAYQFNPDHLDGYQMFNVHSNQGILHINLNTDHPIYDLIHHVEERLGAESDESNPAFQAIVALRLLLSSWARMEDHTESREERMHIQDIATRWGR